MKLLAPNKVLIEDASELPIGATTCKELYHDVETTSFQFDEYGNQPYNGHRVCGSCVTWDDHPRAYYIPVRHNTNGKLLPGNVSIDKYQQWCKDTLKNPNLKRWTNQNIKFDMHFLLQEGAEIPRIGGPEIWCTLTHAKLLDTDRLTKGGYGLDALSSWLLNENINEYELQVKQYLQRLKQKNKKAVDYGHVAIDIMANYGCQDALTTRAVALELRKRCPEVSREVWKTETLLTPILFDMERDGEHVDSEALQLKELELLTELTVIEEQIQKMTGQSCTPSNTNHCFEMLCGKYGLPVLAWTEGETGNPSFTYDALLQYLALPEVMYDKKLTWLITTMMDYREKHTLLTYFVQPYLRFQVNGIMHPTYDQCKRTGRLGCKEPNMQQLSPEAKELILPGKGRAFLCCDYSQIEFRLLVHYMNNPEAVEAYNRNPDTDFHQWVADMCGINRKPAKNVNFAMGYGGGKLKVVTMLAGDKSLIGKLNDIAIEMCKNNEINIEIYDFIKEVVKRGDDMRYKENPKTIKLAAGLLNKIEELTPEDSPALFAMLCKQRGEEVYRQYHARLPELKRESRAAASVCARNGFVKTPYGRQRHLPRNMSWLAINSVTQGWAADIIKERTVALAPRYNATTRELGLSLAAQVHDENRFVGDEEATRNPIAVRHVTSIMENHIVPIRVPIRSSASWSNKNWREASDDKSPNYKKLEINRELLKSEDPTHLNVEC